MLIMGAFLRQLSLIKDTALKQKGKELITHSEPYITLIDGYITLGDNKFQNADGFINLSKT